MRRREDVRFTTGRGRYVSDHFTLGEVHAVFVRSPHAHAKIQRCNVGAALATPGVLAAFTGQDLRGAGVGSIPCGWLIRNRDDSPMAEPPHYPLAVEKVRHAGEPVAIVIAESVAEAKSAAELVDVEYELHEAVVDGRGAADPSAPRVWDELPSNVCCDWELGDAAGTDAAFAKAAHVTRLDLLNNRLVPAPMEPRAALASFEAGTGHTTLYTTSQNPHTIRSTLCQVLGLSETSLRVVSPDVGGGFGAKIFLYPEETAITWATARVGRPIRWTSDRSEAFLTDAHGRDHQTRAELALDDEGRFVGLRVKTYANVGAYLSSGATAIPTFYYAQLLAGVYQTANIYCNVVLVFTNTCSVDAYRGAGRPEATYVLERLIDQAARETGRDRVELRRLNFIRADQFPYKTPVGLEYDSGDHEATLRIALAQAQWELFEERRLDALRRGMLRGIGLSTYVEIAGGTPSRLLGQLGGRGGRAESAQVRVHPSGAVTVFSGSHSHGQGHETAFAQLVCETLGVAFEKVTVVQGDTDQVPFGRGTAASRSLVIGGSAILRAIDKVKDKGRRIAGHLLEASSDDIVFADGAFRVAGTDKSVPFAAVAKAAYSGHDFPSDEIEPGLDETAYYDPKNWTYPGGCHVCEIEIDPETGATSLVQIVAVDDLGNIVNPLIVEGQIHGGLAQGIGQALFEHCTYDADGQLLSGSYMDYQVPRAADLPTFDVLTHSTPCEHNPLKAKGCAEVGSVGVPPAIVNAILDALRRLGVNTIEMPATPAAIWRALHQAKSIQGVVRSSNLP